MPLYLFSSARWSNDADVDLARTAIEGWLFERGHAALPFTINKTPSEAFCFHIYVDDAPAEVYLDEIRRRFHSSVRLIDLSGRPQTKSTVKRLY